MATRWAVGGGAAVFLGSLLPFISGSYVVNGGINAGARVVSVLFGLILAGLAIASQFASSSAGPRRVFGIILLALSGLGVLGYLGFTLIGVVGVTSSDGFVSVHETYSPDIGIILAILGCAAALYGGILAVRKPST